MLGNLLKLALDTGSEVKMSGRVNITDEALLENIHYAIRQGHPQIMPSAPNSDKILLVGGGPSLESTKAELIQLYFEGAKVATVNGAYQWCIQNNIRPSIQIVVDSRDHNSRFVNPPVPNCTYLLASQCAPSTWNEVQGRERVWIWHALGEGDEKIVEMLDQFYLKRWHGIAGGTTVTIRALSLLRTLGFMQYDLFGVDSCWGPKGEHHAYEQPENNNDKRLPVRISPSDDSHEGKEFWVAPWHLAQMENFLHLIQMGGDAFGRITVHGDGMLAYAMHTLAGDLIITDMRS